MIFRSYSELRQIPTYKERYDYLRLGGKVGESTFGFDRYLNQALYRDSEWKRLRNKIILRDNGCDMGLADYEIGGRIIIHHLTPITELDILERNPCLFDEDNLVCVSHKTHEAIHYGDESLLDILPKERKPGDTCPWR